MVSGDTLSAQSMGTCYWSLRSLVGVILLYLFTRGCFPFHAGVERGISLSCASPTVQSYVCDVNSNKKQTKKPHKTPTIPKAHPLHTPPRSRPRAGFGNGCSMKLWGHSNHWSCSLQGAGITSCQATGKALNPDVLARSPRQSLLIPPDSSGGQSLSPAAEPLRGEPLGHRGPPARSGAAVHSALL